MHTHTQNSLAKPWGLSPAWHWTLQGRQHLLSSIFYTIIKEHCLLRKLLIFTSFLFLHVQCQIQWTPHTMASILRCIFAVQVATESSQSARRRSQSKLKAILCGKFWQTWGLLPFKALLLHLSFQPCYVRCSVAWSLNSLPTSLCLLEEI